MKFVDVVRTYTLGFSSIFLGAKFGLSISCYFHFPFGGRVLCLFLFVCLFLELPSIASSIIYYLKHRRSMSIIYYLNNRRSKKISKITYKKLTKTELVFFYFYSFCFSMILVKDIGFFHDIYCDHSFVLRYVIFITLTVVLFLFFCFYISNVMRSYKYNC